MRQVRFNHFRLRRGTTKLSPAAIKHSCHFRPRRVTSNGHFFAPSTKLSPAAINYFQLRRVTTKLSPAAIPIGEEKTPAWESAWTVFSRNLSTPKIIKEQTLPEDPPAEIAASIPAIFPNYNLEINSLFSKLLHEAQKIKDILVEGNQLDKVTRALVELSSTIEESKSVIAKEVKRHLPPTPVFEERCGTRMKAYLEFVTTPTADTPGTALILHFDDKRYLIGNVHEGTSRACMQRGMRLLKVSDIFVTGKTEWENTGGLIGVIMTLADGVASQAVSIAAHRQDRHRGSEKGDRELLQSTDSGKKEQASEQSGGHSSLTIHGGPNILHSLATARRFVFRKSMPVNVEEYNDAVPEVGLTSTRESDWADARIRVWKMAIAPSSNQQGSSPKSPNKRSFNDYEDGVLSASAVNNSRRLRETSPSNREQSNREIRRSVITAMFNSAWKRDNLVETPLIRGMEPATLFTRNSTSNNIERYTGPMPDENTIMPDTNVLVRTPWPGAMVGQLPSTKPSSTAMSYIIRTHQQRGRFRPENAKKLNVQKGPLWSELTSGHSVTSRDGTIVTPDMVLDGGQEGTGFAVIDLPSVDYVENLVNRPEWSVDGPVQGIGAVIWMLGPGVGENKTLRRFINNHSDLNHIFSSQDYCPNYLSMESSAAAAIRLNQIDPPHHVVPIFDNITLPQPGQLAMDPGSTDDFIQAQRGLKIQLRPTFQVQEQDSVPVFDTAAVLTETPKAVLELAQVARKDLALERMQEDTADQGLPSQDAEIICLGTGSASPSKYRNVSATLLRVPGRGSYLLDCGENTLGQLKRIYTPPQLAEVLRDLKLIWISHLHADHHLGTASVIKAWYEEVHGKNIAVTKPQIRSVPEQLLDCVKMLQEGKHLFVVSHGHMMSWLYEYSFVEDYGYDQIIPLCSFPVKQPTLGKEARAAKLEWNGLEVGFGTSFTEVNQAMRAATGLSELTTCSVSHCYGAQAVSLTFPTGFKFSYSGDCRPSKAFAEIGKGSTVLLHEATFDDELQSDAIAKKHSTTSEAIGVGLAMGAKRLLLTHFSQRYQKIPMMESLGGIDVRLEDAGEAQDTIEGMGEAEGSSNAMAVEMMESTSTGAERIADGKDVAIEQDAYGSSATDFTLPNPQLKDMKIGVAFDYMRVKVSEIAQLEKFTPALVKLFEASESDSKANSTLVHPNVDVIRQNFAEQGKTRKFSSKQRKRFHAEQQKLIHGAKIEEASAEYETPAAKPGNDTNRATYNQAVQTPEETRRIEGVRRMEEDAAAKIQEQLEPLRAEAG